MSNTIVTGSAPAATQQATRRFQINLRRRESLAAYVFLLPFMFFFCLFVVRGVAAAVNMSFYDWDVLSPVHKYLGLGNYNELINDDIWWLSLKNTLIFAVMTVAGSSLVALGAALALNQPVRGRGFFRVLLYAPSLLSAGVVGTTWVWLLNTQFGIVNYALHFFGIPAINWLGDSNLVLPALSLTTIWWTFGFPMLLFLAGLQGIPTLFYEAARIDGASPRQIFFYITLPLLRPTILFVTVLGFISHMQLFSQNFIMTTGGPGYASYSVIYYLYQIAWKSFRMGYGSAVAILLAAIIVIFTALQFILIGRRVQY